MCPLIKDPLTQFNIFWQVVFVRQHDQHFQFSEAAKTVMLMLLAAFYTHVPKVPFASGYSIKITGYSYHSFNIITFDPSQNDHIISFHCKQKQKQTSMGPGL